MAWLRSKLTPLFLSALTACALIGTSSASAQQSTQRLQEWTLQNVRAAWCVHFLMDSAAADKELPREFRPVRASDFPELSPAVTMLITGEPEYQRWIPAEWCSFHFDQAKIGDQTMGDPDPQLERTQYLGIWLIAGVPTNDSGNPTRPSYYIATMRTPNWRFIRLAETSLIRVEHAEPEIGKVPERTDDRYRIAMGKTIITFDGHLAGDSALAAVPEEQTWWSIGSRGARLVAQVRLEADKKQNVAGTLQIAGNDALAKSLRASPIRMVGPLQWGGFGTVSFAR